MSKLKMLVLAAMAAATVAIGAAAAAPSASAAGWVRDGNCVSVVMPNGSVVKLCL